MARLLILFLTLAHSADDDARAALALAKAEQRQRALNNGRDRGEGRRPPGERQIALGRRQRIIKGDTSTGEGQVSLGDRQRDAGATGDLRQRICCERGYAKKHGATPLFPRPRASLPARHPKIGQRTFH